MSAEPYDVNQIVALLQASVPALRQVGVAADYAAVKTIRDFAPPCAYVLLAREKAKPHASSTGMQQDVQGQRSMVTFGVVLAVRNYKASDRGKQQADALAPILGAVRTALIGWIAPVKGARPIQFIQGDVVDYDQATLLWTEVYQTQHSLQ